MSDQRPEGVSGSELELLFSILLGVAKGIGDNDEEE